MLGNLGSGKTACMVRELALNPSRRMTYSNIITKNIKTNTLIKPEMIIEKELLHTKKTGEESYKYHLNVDFWKNIVKKHTSINVILDEAHTLVDSRRSMSKLNKVMSDFIALLRRVIGQDNTGYGELVLISQLERRLDIIAREMATQVRYHICHYRKICLKCGCKWSETNETAEKFFKCRRCKSYEIKKQQHVIEVLHFIDYAQYMNWKFSNIKSYYKRYYIQDIEKYFPLYDTLQWDNLITEL